MSTRAKSRSGNRQQKSRKRRRKRGRGGGREVVIPERNLAPAVPAAEHPDSEFFQLPPGLAAHEWDEFIFERYYCGNDTPINVLRRISKAESVMLTGETMASYQISVTNGFPMYHPESQVQHLGKRLTGEWQVSSDEAVVIVDEGDGIKVCRVQVGSIHEPVIEMSASQLGMAWTARRTVELIEDVVNGRLKL